MHTGNYQQRLMKSFMFSPFRRSESGKKTKKKLFPKPDGIISFSLFEAPSTILSRRQHELMAVEKFASNMRCVSSAARENNTR